MKKIKIISTTSDSINEYTPVDINLEQIEYNKRDNCPVGFWEDLFNSKKHDSLEEAKKKNDFATVFTVRDKDGIFFWRICQHPKEKLTYLRFDIQDPRFGIDEMDKQQMYEKVGEILS
jgi:hypothetical protein